MSMKILSCVGKCRSSSVVNNILNFIGMTELDKFVSVYFLSHGNNLTVIHITFLHLICPNGQKYFTESSL